MKKRFKVAAAMVSWLAGAALTCVADDAKKNDFPVGSYWDGGWRDQADI
jgi:hypothetical protein